VIIKGDTVYHTYHSYFLINPQRSVKIKRGF